MTVKDLFTIPDIIALAEVARITLDEVNGRRAVLSTRLLTLKELTELRHKILDFLEVVNTMETEDLTKQIELEVHPQESEITINLDKYLDPLSFLVTIETARVLLGDKTRREWVLEYLSLDVDSADEVYTRLSRLMAEIRSTEHKIPQRGDIPALESGKHANAQ